MPIKTLQALCMLMLLSSCGASSEMTAIESGGMDSGPVNFGVLVMAHGGGDLWNAAVAESVDDLRRRFPVEVAFGMADAGSLELAVRRLEAQGAEHVGVVRMFISGESWFERTEQILGLREGAPGKDEWEAGAKGRGDRPMAMGFWRIETDLNFHLSQDGLADADEMDAVLLSRMTSLAVDPENEVAVVLAHGPAEDSENQRWINKIRDRTRLAASTLGLHEVRVFTLREDWREKRQEAEQQIRAYVQQAQAAGREVLVVPYRVQGFGPYAEVLSGLEYRADQLGLLPHDNVGLWISNQANALHQEATEHHLKLLADIRF